MSRDAMPAAPAGTSVRRRLLLDLDTGIDDALALAYALGSPEVELVGVVCGYGNVTLGAAVRNTTALLALLGHPEIPVLAGADRPLGASNAFEPPAGVVRIHGANGLGDQPIVWQYRDGGVADGMALLRGEMRRSAEEILYVPTGPLTNLAALLRDDPGLTARLGRVTFMGGALTVPGNVTPCAEANVHNDPEAASAVLRSGLATRMIGLDVTHQVVLTRADTAAWRGLATPAARFFADMTDHYIDIYEANNPQMGGCALHDPLAVASALDPTLVRCLPTNLRVDLEGSTRGRTVCDPDRLREPRKTCEVALAVDAPRFLDEFRTRVTRALLAGSD